VSVDAAQAISADLEALRRARARHFGPALLLSLLLVGGFFVLSGLRPDLWQQPPWQIALQLAVWLLCLVALPAVGLGLWFPSRPARGLLAVGAVLAALGAALGPGLADMFSGTGPSGHMQVDMCVQATLGAGAALLAVGVLSGAFAQRRRRASVLWVSGGIALTALDAVVWHCPSQDLGHNLRSHLGAALLLLLLAAATAAIAHRRQRG
jgi:hypothetical protein